MEICISCFNSKLPLLRNVEKDTRIFFFILSIWLIFRFGIDHAYNCIYTIFMNLQDDLDLCRSLLVKVKGVISVTFDFKTKRSILRCRNELKPEVLKKLIFLYA